jgi:hypothetical protein
MSSSREPKQDTWAWRIVYSQFNESYYLLYHDPETGKVCVTKSGAKQRFMLDARYFDWNDVATLPLKQFVQGGQNVRKGGR